MIRTPPHKQTDPAKLPGQVVNPIKGIPIFTNGFAESRRWNSTHKHTANCPSSCFR